MWRICGRGFDPRRLHQFKRARFFELFFFSCCAPVLARVLAMVRRTSPPGAAPFRALFRSLFPPILCFCEGRLHARTSNDAGLRLLVRNENHSTNRLLERPAHAAFRAGPVERRGGIGGSNMRL